MSSITADGLVMSPEQVQRLAGGYKQPAKQLTELHRRGFYRAWRSRVTGEVIVERAHYDAVCSGGLPGTEQRARPQVRVPQLKAVR